MLETIQLYANYLYLIGILDIIELSTKGSRNNEWPIGIMV